MDFEHVAVREDVTLEAVTRYLRRLDELPDHTDQLFVVDRDQVLKGTLPLARLIVSDLEREVRQVMVAERVKLYAHDRAEDAASAFERYDLVSAPVVDASERLIGRLTVDAVVDYIRERARSRSSPRLACGRRRTSSRRCSTASRTAGPGSRSTWSPRSSPRASSACSSIPSPSSCALRGSCRSSPASAATRATRRAP